MIINNIELYDEVKVKLKHHPEKKKEILEERFRFNYEHYKTGFVNKLLKILNPSHLKLAKLYSFILILLFVLFQGIIIIHNGYIKSQQLISDISIENEYLKKSFSALGGLGLDVTEIEKMDAEDINNAYLRKHGLKNYIWKYKEIGYPVNPEKSFVTNENVKRYINQKEEINIGIDMRQITSLETIAPISGFCRISHHKIYGNNILIESFMVMENELDKKEIFRVSIRLSHLSKILVKDGQWVKKKDLVAYMGNSGRCATYDSKLGYWREITEKERQLGYGVHLDLELKINGCLRNFVANSTFGEMVRL